MYVHTGFRIIVTIGFLLSYIYVCMMKFRFLFVCCAFFCLFYELEEGREIVDVLCFLSLFR